MTRKSSSTAPKTTGINEQRGSSVLSIETNNFFPRVLFKSMGKKRGCGEEAKSESQAARLKNNRQLIGFIKKMINNKNENIEKVYFHSTPSCGAYHLQAN